MTTADAAERGFHPLTGPYGPSEAKLLAGVTADMRRSAIPFCLVEESPGHFSVWRKNMILPGECRAAVNRPKLIPRD